MLGTLIAIFVWASLMIVLALSMSGFLRLLEFESPERYAELDPERESFGNHLGPLRISMRYILPGKFSEWDLGARAHRSAQRLRLVTIAVLLSFAAMLAVAIIEYG